MKTKSASLLASILSAIVLMIFSFPATGGVVAVDEGGVTTTTGPVFAGGELQLDAFAANTLDGIADHEGWGWGVGLNYFFNPNLGFGVDLGSYEGGSEWATSVSAVLRLPIDSLNLAPYAFGGVSSNFNDWDDLGTDIGYHLGAGVEARLRDNFGIFAEYRYTWFDNVLDTEQLAVGVRLTF